MNVYINRSRFVGLYATYNYMKVGQIYTHDIFLFLDYSLTTTGIT